jgi:aspartate aminotransferase-like enzyme
LHGCHSLIVLLQCCSVTELAFRRHSIDGKGRTALTASQKALVAVPGMAHCMGTWQVYSLKRFQAHLQQAIKYYIATTASLFQLLCTF